jgi:hypothetical protein
LEISGRSPGKARIEGDSEMRTEAESKLTREEQETHVWGNAGSNEWEVYTTDPKHLRRFDRLQYQVIHEDRFGKRYRVPIHAVRFGRPERTKRALSERQRGNIVKAQAARKSKQVLLSSEDQNLPAMVG